MVERIGGIPSPEERPLEIKIQNLSRDIHNLLTDFIDGVRKIVANPGLLDHPDLLKHLADTIITLAPKAKQALELRPMTLQEEDLQDAGEILKNILEQPLAIPGEKTDMSLLQAAEKYDLRSALTSHLRKIFISFMQFPEPTETMLRELDLMKNDLKST